MKGGLSMTHNQIDFWNYKENARHNLAAEAELSRHNVSVEKETNRHNVATEANDMQQIAVNQATVAETARHNSVMEEIGYYNAQSQALQANAAYLNAQASWANVGVNQQNADSNRITADASASNAQTRRDELAESKRHNKTAEGQSERDLWRKEKDTDSAVEQRKQSIQESKSKTFYNYINGITGGYRNITSGISDVINATSNVVMGGLKSIGGLLK